MSVFRPFAGEAGKCRGASGTAGVFVSRYSFLKPPPDWMRVFAGFGRQSMAQEAGQEIGSGRPG